MNVNNNTPDIRFSGFGGDWNKRKLAELVQPVSSYPLSRGVEVNEDTKYRYIHYGDIHRGKLKVIKSEKQLSNIPMGNYELLEKGDLVVADASEDYEGIANPCVLDYELQDKVVAGLHTIAMRPINTDSLYLYNLFHTDSFKSHGRFIGTGTKVFGISAKNLLKFESFVPELNEQAAIGNIFKHIDKAIALSRSKQAKTKMLKNAFLIKMFPQTGKSQPEIRLKGFSGNWVERKLGDISNTFSGGTPSVGYSDFYGGKIPFIRSGEISSYTTSLFLTEEGLINSSAKLVDKGNILYALYGATSGEVSISNINGAINQAILAIIPFKEYNTEFISYWLRRDKYRIIDTYLQGGQGNLSGDIIKNLVLKIPSKLQEQTAIGNFFKQLDDTLALQAKQLKALENLKKALLAKMFV